MAPTARSVLIHADSGNSPDASPGSGVPIYSAFALGASTPWMSVGGTSLSSPEWGAMIATARRFILDHWWVPTVPGIAIFVTSLAFNLLGDGLRDVLDPKQR